MEIWHSSYKKTHNDKNLGQQKWADELSSHKQISSLLPLKDLIEL